MTFEIRESIILEKAYAFAERKHSGQLDDEGKASFLHPYQTFCILKQVTDDKNLLAAGLLHDTLEDTETSYDELVKEFNKDVANLVMEVTHEGHKDDHGYYFPRLKTKRGIMLKFADRLSNLSRMESWDEKRKEQYLQRSKFWKSE